MDLRTLGTSPFLCKQLTSGENGAFPVPLLGYQVALAGDGKLSFTATQQMNADFIELENYHFFATFEERINLLQSSVDQSRGGGVGSLGTGGRDSCEPACGC